jgi:peptidylprolyl isomerase/peptidyl-prolyl cis-trans isomerase D
VGATRSASLKTKEEAKKSADSIYALVRYSKTKFTEVADEVNTDGTKGKGGDIGWVRKDQAFSAGFDKAFADFIYTHKAGSISVVETAFGYHVIRVDEQTTPEKAVRLATYARLIEASEETENNIFEEAETLASKLADGINLDEIAAEEGLITRSAVNLKVLEENIPGMNSQRQIVTWAFNAERELGDSKRFDVDVAGKRGYAVVLLKGKTEEDGIVVSSDLLARIRPELINKKKAAAIIENMKGSTLEEIAKNSNTTVRSASLVTLTSPLLSGVGNEPAIVGAMSTLKIDEVSDKIEGAKGVFVLKVTKREAPIQLENYDTFRNSAALKLQARTYQIFKVLEETADIRDNRGKFF